MVLKIQTTEGTLLNPFLKIFEKKYNLKRYPFKKYISLDEFLQYSPYTYLTLKKKLVASKHYFAVEFNNSGIWIHPDTFNKYLKHRALKLLEKEIEATESFLKKL